jgi:hypothetical protein
MKNWTIGVNGYKNTAHVCVTDLPLYIWLIEWLFDHWLNHDLIPAIPFPRYFLKSRDKDYPEELSTLRDWYGDLSQWYCGTVCTPIIYWAWNHPKRKDYYIQLTYEEAKEKFYSWDKKFFDEQDAQTEEMKEEDKANINLL